MRILFDQCTPIGIKRVLREHEVATAFELGWSTLQNGDLLRAAEAEGFELLITSDQNLAYQQNLPSLKLAVLALRSGRWSQIEPLLGHIAEAVRAAKPGTYTLLDIPQ